MPARVQAPPLVPITWACAVCGRTGASLDVDGLVVCDVRQECRTAARALAGAAEPRPRTPSAARAALQTLRARYAAARMAK